MTDEKATAEGQRTKADGDGSAFIVPQSSLIWVMIVAVLASSMVFIDGTAFNVALPALQESLNASGADLLAIVNAYALFLTSLLLLGGALGDRYGRKLLFGIGIGIFSAASLLCGLAPDTGFLIGARAVQGVGAALLVPGSLSLITALFPAERRARAIGIWSACTVVVTAIGPFLGGVLAQAGMWRGVFFLNLPLAVLALAVLWRFVPESRDERAARRLDYAGAGAATLGLLGVNYGLIEAASPKLDALLVSLALIGGVGFVLIFLAIEASSAHPLLPLRLFRSWTFCGANLVTLCLYIGFNGLLLFLPLNLIQVQGYDAALAGLAQLPVIGLLALVAPWSGGLGDRIGARPLLIAGSLVAGAGFACFALPGLTRGPVDYWTTFFPALSLLGLGMALIIPPLSSSVVSSVPADQAGLASGINSTAARLASVLAVPLLGAVGIIAFGTSLETRSTALELPDSARSALMKGAVHLGNTPVPDEVDPLSRIAVQEAIQLAFVDAFRFIAWMAASLAWLGAVLAALLIGRKSAVRDQKSPRTSDV